MRKCTRRVRSEKFVKMQRTIREFRVESWTFHALKMRGAVGAVAEDA